MPAALTYPIGSRFYDWRYESEPEPYMGGRRIYHARGKVLGGSSSINGMIFQRGNPLDYERWAADPGWRPGTTPTACPTSGAWRTAPPRRPTTPSGATAGRWSSSAAQPSSPLFQAFFQAAEEAGFARTADVNGYRQEGFAPFDRNIRRGRRWSATRAYLDRARGRRNLEVRTRAFVTRVTFDGKRATGVEVARGLGRAVERIEARRGDPVRRRVQLARSC